MIRQIKKYDYFEIYRQAYNNALDLAIEAQLLFDNKYYPRAYFLAYTALEEISKSQLAADVFTGYSKEDNFIEKYANHKIKINQIGWAHLEANTYPYNQIWLGPDVDNIEKIVSKEPSWEKRLNSLYVGIKNTEVVIPSEQIGKNDAHKIIHILDIALKRIWDIEHSGHQIGTKGFMK